MSDIVVSVVVPAFNEERVIGSCLEALRMQDFPITRFEVIVIDNGSTDRTLRIVRSYAEVLNIRIEVRPGIFVSELRNAGAEIAAGKYLGFIDADCLVAPDWLLNLTARFKSNSEQVLGSRYKIPERSSWMARAWYADTLVEGVVSYLPGGSLSITRKDFFSIGGFDASLETNEDYEFCQRARDAGLLVRADPCLAVTHLGTPQTLKEFFRKQRWHGTHVFKVFWRSLPKLRNTKAVLYTLYVLAACCACIAGAAWWLFSHSAVILIAAVGTGAAGPVALGVCRAFSDRRPALAIHLIILYFMYGIARVCSLTSAGRHCPSAARNAII